MLKLSRPRAVERVTLDQVRNNVRQPRRLRGDEDLDPSYTTPFPHRPGKFQFSFVFDQLHKVVGVRFPQVPI
jgi:hypothetical protein